MGEELNKRDAELDRTNEKPLNPGTGSGTDGKPGNGDGNSPSATAGTGTPAGAGTGAKRGRPRKTEKEKAAGLASVESTPPTVEQPKKKQARPKKKKQAEPKPFEAEQISALIQTASNILGSRPGYEVFVLSKAEADQLAAPLASMAEKSETLSNMGEHADAFALVTASIMIFTPRFIVFSEQRKQKKKNVGVVKHEPEKQKAAGTLGENDGKSSAHGPAYASLISSTIPSTM